MNTTTAKGRDRAPDIGDVTRRAGRAAGDQPQRRRHRDDAGPITGLEPQPAVWTTSSGRRCDAADHHVAADRFALVEECTRARRSSGRTLFQGERHTLADQQERRTRTRAATQSARQDDVRLETAGRSGSARPGRRRPRGSPAPPSRPSSSPRSAPRPRSRAAPAAARPATATGVGHAHSARSVDGSPREHSPSPAITFRNRIRACSVSGIRAVMNPKPSGAARRRERRDRADGVEESGDADDRRRSARAADGPAAPSDERDREDPQAAGAGRRARRGAQAAGRR